MVLRDFCQKIKTSRRRWPGYYGIAHYSDRILFLQASGVISSGGSLNGSQSSLLSGSEVSLAETAGPGDLEKRDSGLGTDSEMNGNEEVKGEQNGNSEALKVVNGKSSTESESLLLETAVS